MIKKLIANIPALIIAVLIAWIALSWVDVVTDNNTAQPVHSENNFFYLLSEGATI
jgi:hypothetical protein